MFTTRLVTIQAGISEFMVLKQTVKYYLCDLPLKNSKAFSQSQGLWWSSMCSEFRGNLRTSPLHGPRSWLISVACHVVWLNDLETRGYFRSDPVRVQSTHLQGPILGNLIKSTRYAGSGGAGPDGVVYRSATFFPHTMLCGFHEIGLSKPRHQNDFSP